MKNYAFLFWILHICILHICIMHICIISYNKQYCWCASSILFGCKNKTPIRYCLVETWVMDPLGKTPPFLCRLRRIKKRRVKTTTEIPD